MERLVTTSQAAHILGISLQGVHYRIKKDQLKSINQSGKVFVYITDKMEEESIKEQSKPNIIMEDDIQNIQSIIEIKDEQISLLKKSLKWTKKQYSSEINRLERNQNNIINVFQSEIKLLQSAFNEMRSIYKPQIKENYISKIDNNKFITILDFTILMKKYNKTQSDIKNIMLEAIESSDERFIYNKNDKKLLILNSDFEDLI